MSRGPKPKYSQQPSGVVQNWSALQCSKKHTEQCGYDHAPVTRGRMRAQFPLPHGPCRSSIDPVPLLRNEPLSLPLPLLPCPCPTTQHATLPSHSFCHMLQWSEQAYLQLITFVTKQGGSVLNGVASKFDNFSLDSGPTTDPKELRREDSLSSRAPELRPGDVCTQCRQPFGITRYRYHCPNCGNPFCRFCHPAPLFTDPSISCGVIAK